MASRFTPAELATFLAWARAGARGSRALGATAEQVPLEEQRGGRGERVPVRLLLEPVPFVGGEHVPDFPTFGSQLGHDLLGLAQRHAWVVLALCHEQRS